MRNPFRATCEETAANMSAAADGELRGLRRWRVMRHILVCEICGPVYRSLLATIQGLRGLGSDRPRASASFVDDVVARLDEADDASS